MVWFCRCINVRITQTAETLVLLFKKSQWFSLASFCCNVVLLLTLERQPRRLSGNQLGHCQPCHLLIAPLPNYSCSLSRATLSQQITHLFTRSDKLDDVFVLCQCKISFVFLSKYWNEQAFCEINCRKSVKSCPNRRIVQNFKGFLL